ncbi:flagella basal body P-ring formation protein FlgA [Rhodothalassium salexigens DSM 2132]|uniref:Flagella basal body P-ring formation protein FlgA n=1 Tax=Rhodothalassium salexigens DSM 2132 TaxID=1188247 RepID=A0A4V2SQD4_RHOSA|nr:flagellar basal body P-ring formation chaperone FlgA [Rhodothalassium salexigens]MBB4210412.1 flagella basal body P-ring formation protein FlgA [Rhodothalassium salexigens DSM 2132]MBK1640059.1 flagella basal body P-ring formation protein FlgA [Rhodothalassium salexigens DSM 2132]TCP38576.1 flagella basal body P-ring formation protein FlgA [Rhodothalassium salexigens DSM 2132]
MTRHQIRPSTRRRPIRFPAVRLAAGLMAGLVAAGAAQAASLKPYARVEGAEIRLSHVVEGAGDAGAMIIGAAPPPGDELVLSASNVVRLARANGVELAEVPAITRIQVERPGLPVGRDEIADRLLQALRDLGYDDDYEVGLLNTRLTVYMPVNADLADLKVDNVRFTEHTGRIMAELVVPQGQGRTERVTLNGMAQRMQHVPVLTRALSPGDTIERADLEWERQPARRVNRGAVLEMEDLLGMSLRRRVRPGQTLRATDVETPQLVERGQLVAMVLQRGALTLTATGKALQSGGDGDLIRLQNTATHRVVEGRVTAGGRVAVGAMGPIRTAQRGF